MAHVAPWFALAQDWWDCELCELINVKPDRNTMRLAWICLLSECKANGRGGKVRLRIAKFTAKYQLDDEASVHRLVDFALKAGSIKMDGEIVTITGWQAYQQKVYLKEWRDKRALKEVKETREVSAPVTHHQGPPSSGPLVTDMHKEAPPDRSPRHPRGGSLSGDPNPSLSRTDRQRAERQAEDARVLADREGSGGAQATGGD